MTGAPTDPLGHLTSVERTPRGLLASFGAAALSITALTPALLRIRLAPNGHFAPSRPWAVTMPDDAFEPCPAEGQNDPAAVRLLTGEIAATLQRSDGHLSIEARADGRAVLSDASSGGARWSRDGGAGWTFRMPAGEHYYATGERTGLLEKRGRRYSFWPTDQFEQQGPQTDPLYQAIPFLLALDGAGRSFGIFLNNTYRSVFDLSALQEEQFQMQVAGGQLDWYFIYGPDPAGVVRRYTELTGRMPLPPRWALGFQRARWGWKSQAVVHSIGREFRARRIPLDALYLDIDHMDGYRVFTWDSAGYPNPAALARGLARDGVKLVAVLDPGVKYQPEGGYHVFTEGERRGFLLRKNDGGLVLGYVWPGLCALPDFTRPEVREWWGDLHRELLDAGVRGVLNDMNEPALHGTPVDAPDTRLTELPSDLRYSTTAEPATHAEVHNIYASLEDAASYCGLTRLRPESRPFLLSRAGFAGVQRHAGTWTGDNASVWEHLEMSIPELLNLGLSGIAFAGADIGGFCGNCTPELLARWFQLGSLYPLARCNSAEGTAPQEPWTFGDEIERYCRAAVELRYRLLPYLYTLLEAASREGDPIFRPLFYHYPADRRTHELADEVLLGRDLLLAPVVRPGWEVRAVYLPRGRWFDLRTGDRHCGPADILAPAPLHLGMPLYVRGGAILPAGPVLQYTDEAPLDPLTLEVFPDDGGNATGWLYEDDGLTPAYRKGEFCRTRFTCRPASTSRLTVAAVREGPYRPAHRAVELRVHAGAQPARFRLEADEGNWEVTL